MVTMEERPMWEVIAINVLCLLVALGALGIVVWALVSGQAMNQGIDGLFLVIVCLLIAAAFSMGPLKELRRGVLRDLLLNRTKSKPPEPEARQAAAAASAEAQERS